MDTYIGIDMGSSSVKLLLMDEQREVLAQSALEYEVSHPHEGWAEIDPSLWYDRTMEGLRLLLEGQDGKSVSAIGVTGQMHTLTLLGGEGNPLRPSMMWNDKRTARDIPLLRERLAACPDADGRYLAGIVSTGSPAANLYWVSREEPWLFERLRNFLIGPDYLTYRLTGRIGTDFVEASTSSLYSLQRRAWSEEMRTFIGLSPTAYPPIRGSAETVGPLLPELARGLGLREGVVRVIAGTGDNSAAAISTGCIGQGHPVLSLGTSGVLVFPFEPQGKEIVEEVPRGKIILFSPDAKSFSHLVQGAVQSAGESIRWWTLKVLGLQDLEGLDDGMDDARIRSSKVLFYPHINGDKTLYADPDLRGAFIGLSNETDAAEMYHAVLEGLCFAFRQLAEGVGLDLHEHRALKVVGGGARSDRWLRTLANVLDVHVERLGGFVGPAFGAALLAYAADHPDEGLEGSTAASLRVERTFAPDGGEPERYRDKYERYLRIHDALKHIDP